MNNILLIDDDKSIQLILAAVLNDFTLIHAETLREARQLINEFNFCALLVDIELTDGDGLSFLAEIISKDKFKEIPVMVISSHTKLPNKITAFSIGADDFIAKPFDPIELKSRLVSKLKKNNLLTGKTDTRQLGNLTLDLNRSKALFQLDTNKKEELTLTIFEFRILCLLTKNLEMIYSRAQILNHVWGDTNVAERVIDSHISRLRDKLKPTQLKIKTSKYQGYYALLEKSNIEILDSLKV